MHDVSVKMHYKTIITWHSDKNLNAKGIRNQSSNTFKMTHKYTEDSIFRAFFMLAFTMNTRDNVTEMLLEILCKYGCFTYLFKFLSERQDVNLPTEDKFCNLKHSTIDYTFS